jgi:hypothetical protein
VCLLSSHNVTHHRGMGKPSELYSEVSQGGKLVYHVDFFFRQS